MLKGGVCVCTTEIYDWDLRLRSKTTYSTITFDSSGCAFRNFIFSTFSRALWSLEIWHGYCSSSQTANKARQSPAFAAILESVVHAIKTHAPTWQPLLSHTFQCLFRTPHPSANADVALFITSTVSRERLSSKIYSAMASKALKVFFRNNIAFATMSIKYGSDRISLFVFSSPPLTDSYSNVRPFLGLLKGEMHQPTTNRPHTVRLQILCLSHINWLVFNSIWCIICGLACVFLETSTKTN